MIQKFVKRQKKKLKWPPSFINRIFNFDKNILSIPFGRNCLLILIIQQLEWIKKPSTLHTVIYNTDTCTRVYEYSLTNLYPLLKSKWLQNIEDRFNGDVVSSSVTPSGEIL